MCHEPIRSIRVDYTRPTFSARSLSLHISLPSKPLKTRSLARFPDPVRPSILHPRRLITEPKKSETTESKFFLFYFPPVPTLGVLILVYYAVSQPPPLFFLFFGTHNEPLPGRLDTGILCPHTHVHTPPPRAKTDRRSKRQDNFWWLVFLCILVFLMA